MTRAACTIVSPNYLAYARTLAASYLAQHPGHRFFVLLVADLADPTPFLGAAFEPVMLPEIGLRDLRGEAMKYDILELNTNVKPAFMRHLITTHALDTLTYLDPDIFVYAPLAPVHDALDAGASAVLTPHMTTPIWDGKSPSEQDILFNGTYNLGFIAVSNSAESLRILDWWDTRCLEAGFSEGRTGLFVDQKWMNLAPGLFDRVHITRHPGLNMAYWNLHERQLLTTPNGYLVAPFSMQESAHSQPGAAALNPQNIVSSPPDSAALHPQHIVSSRPERSAVERPAFPAPATETSAAPLCFFHFSGIVVDDETVLSKHTNRFTLAQRPDLTHLFADYKAAVRAERAAASGADKLPYGFDSFTDGTTITRLARRLYAAHYAHFAGTDPFHAANPFYRFATDKKLVAGTLAPAKETWKDFNPQDRRVDGVHKLLSWALKLLGPHKYELLMRYLGHITVLRNQAIFLRDPNWPR